MPTGFQLGPFFVHFYGIILMTGALAAAFLAEHEARRRGKNGELVWDALVWVLIGGIVGARIWHILTPPPSMVAQGITTQFYLTHPLDALAVWNGGLGIPGAVIGGGIALYFFARRNRLNFAEWVDIAAPAVALGQAIGRWGNYVNQELYGAPTTLPWGIHIDNAPGYPPGTRFHPTFLYESLWNLANMFFLLWLGRRYARRLKAGDVFLTYLVTYPIGRFFIEFLRLDSSQVGGININQWFMLAVAVIASLALFLRHRGGAEEPELEVQGAAAHGAAAPGAATFDLPGEPDPQANGPEAFSASGGNERNQDLPPGARASFNTQVGDDSTPETHPNEPQVP